MKHENGKTGKTGMIIRMLRTAENKSQEQLAKDIGCSRAYLSEVENGNKTPGLEFLKKIANVFDIPLPLLIPDESGKHPDVFRALNQMLSEILAARIMLSEGEKT